MGEKEIWEELKDSIGDSPHGWWELSNALTAVAALLQEKAKAKGHYHCPNCGNEMEPWVEGIVWLCPFDHTTDGLQMPEMTIEQLQRLRSEMLDMAADASIFEKILAEAIVAEVTTVINRKVKEQ